MTRLAPLAVAVLLALVPSPAAAQWTVTAFVGATLSAESGLIDLEEALGKPHGVYGAALGWQRGWLGLDAEVARSDNFFQGSGELVEKGRATTVMGHVTFAVPSGFFRGAVQPFVGIGAGLVRAEQKDLLDIFTRNTSLFGANIAGGVRIRLQPRIGLRADVRFFRTVDREAVGGFTSDYLQFWRMTTGVSFKF